VPRGIAGPTPSSPARDDVHGEFEAITWASERGLNMIITHDWNDPDNHADR
jgi:hypothetical protein